MSKVASELFDIMVEKDCRQLTFHYDPATGMKAILAVDSLPDPAAGYDAKVSGGTRLAHDNADDALADAMNLAKAMTRKCQVLQSTDGGGKSVVVYDKVKNENFIKAIGRFIENQRGLFSTGVDMNLSLDDAELIASQTQYITSLRSNYGSTGENTAQGMFFAFRDNVQRLVSKSLVDTSFAIQGLGAVGAALVQRLVDAGVTDIRICDINDGATDELCKSYSSVKKIDNEDFLKQPVDILCPCNIGGVITTENIQLLQCKVLAPASNNTLTDEAAITEWLGQQNITYIPDFVLNSGGYLQAICERKNTGLETARAQTIVISHAVAKLLDLHEENNKTLWQNAVEIYQ